MELTSRIWSMMQMNLVAKGDCTMKKTFAYLGASLAAIAALSSCNKELSDPSESLKGGIPFEICASISSRDNPVVT